MSSLIISSSSRCRVRCPAPGPVPTRPSRQGRLPVAVHLFCPVPVSHGRIVMIAGAVTALVLVAVTAWDGSSTTVVPAAQAASRTVVVQPGDTLWSIAEAVEPGRDPRAVVRQIMDLNGLRSPQVHAGLRLRLPAG